VLAGHVHAYERTARVARGACDARGPHHVTVGDGGNAEGLATDWRWPQPDWSLLRQSAFGHGEFTAVNGTHLRWRWRQHTAARSLDEFWIVKGASDECGGGVTRAPARRGLNGE
jgi:hypothetical protein